MERVLGEGGFGRVYLARDEELRRQVAIKVPHRHRVSKPEDIESYRVEARILASLDHPHILPVYDVGATEDGRCYVVSKFIRGRSLHAQIEAGRLPFEEGARIIAAVAEALHHAHKHGLVHRDIKPANILLDESGKVYVCDFGLALREEDFAGDLPLAGTPAYMSPEQARCEGHLLDSRSDIFSLGIVLYELLTAKMPFSGLIVAEILEAIASSEPCPPRQVDEAVPRELERICLKALQKRVAERYNAALDMAEDLRHWLSQPMGGESAALQTAGAPKRPAADRPARIVPRGLRSFDAADADFFLDLLPGPRDREGLPENISFWKRRIEAREAEEAFRVGVIYGPSGSGKSSLVKAGLLPRLSKGVRPIYVEATAEGTEAQLQRALAKHCPVLPTSLPEATMALRRGSTGEPKDETVLIVLDQFEQWLHGHGPQATAPGLEADPELVRALRQCDGVRLQCLVLVRDDFWLSLSRFMQALEIELVEGENFALVDLFDAQHARKVLAEFGRAFARLPESLSALSRDQEDFLDQAIASLSEDGRVVPVRLSLFAEMAKGKPWGQGMLRKLGGAEGVGVAFLEDTFSARSANPRHRVKEKVARAVLNAILPKSGSALKGTLRSREELFQASGCASQRDFDELLRILDGELRLLTPADKEDQQLSEKPQIGDAQAAAANRFSYYQLTHDYLVPTLREWLTRKQKETFRGRAQLKLEERAAHWSSKPENRQLPAWWECLTFHWFTRKKSWTDSQIEMMRTAKKFHAARGLALALFLVALAALGFLIRGQILEERRQQTAQALVNSLLVAEITAVPQIIDQLKAIRDLADPILKAENQKAEPGSKPKLHSSLALLPVDLAPMEYLTEELLKAAPENFKVLRNSLFAFSPDTITISLWAVLDHKDSTAEARFRAAAALAEYAPESTSAEKTEKISFELAENISRQPPLLLDRWVQVFEQSEKVLALLERELERKLMPGLGDDPLDQARMEKRKAHVASVLLKCGRREKAWALLKHRPDPSVRSQLIHLLGPLGVDPSLLTARLDTEQNVTIRRASLLALGEYGQGEFPRQGLIPRLQKLYRGDPDPGIHGAAEWLLKKLGDKDAMEKLKQIDKALSTGKVEGERRWYVNQFGQTLVVIQGPVEFLISSPSDGEELHDEKLHKVRIGYSFAISSKEVTVEDFKAYNVKFNYNKSSSPEPKCPINNVSWYEAARYCNWLSEKDGFPRDEWCYTPNDKGEYTQGMKIAPNYLRRRGYRLPTDAEWEYCARAGAITSRFYGGSVDLLGEYAWYISNSNGQSWPTGSKKPNDLGFFDTLGNIWEWCQDLYKIDNGGEAIEALEQEEIIIQDRDMRLVRGGAWEGPPGIAHSSNRTKGPPSYRNYNVGFRLARTYP